MGMLLMSVAGKDRTYVSNLGGKRFFQRYLCVVFLGLEGARVIILAVAAAVRLLFNKMR